MTMRRTAAVFVFMCLTACKTAETSELRVAGADASAAQEISCEVTIVGGGPAGVYAAYRLGEKLHDRLCLFEKEAQLGGRMHDETLSGSADSKDPTAILEKSNPSIL